MRRLQDRVALITGGATGIGRATSLIFAGEGAAIVVVDVRDEESEATVTAIRDAGGHALRVRADVTREDEIAAAVALAERNFGRLDLVVANAGIVGRGAHLPLHKTEHADFVQVVEVNLYGAALTFKHAIPALLRAGGGTMTATTSLQARRGVREGFAAYSASKAAIEGLVRPLAVQYGPTVRVNAVAPGGVATELSRHTAELEGREEISWPERATMSAPKDIALVHLFLASDESLAITGQVLCADRGRSITDAG
jgi:NAD(P)-dependent dehydrogenase (short-subunit alcohol dehydrogenase family)